MTQQDHFRITHVTNSDIYGRNFKEMEDSLQSQGRVLSAVLFSFALPASQRLSSTYLHLWPGSHQTWSCYLEEVQQAFSHLTPIMPCSTANATNIRVHLKCSFLPSRHSPETTSSLNNEQYHRFLQEINTSET